MYKRQVTVQVLTQAREHIIKKTFEAVKGAPHAVIHLYNSCLLYTSIVASLYELCHSLCGQWLVGKHGQIIELLCKHAGMFGIFVFEQIFYQSVFFI